ncbi:hypothetical protein CSA37_04610 [Candidatus Fermentibacteria bacterium]|nr:MAG: hypothetical protein CSA37_06960 [Candidatus Fermentibacteria bacterium]PIE52930.1 MAG: hypothetical protein CSA37_04610 [Candidatus Fermentibacteria bacterium]
MPETGTGKSLMSNTVPLKVLYINPAGGCNLHCRHCWVNEGGSTGETMTLNMWKALLIQAEELGCVSVKLTGGEPLLYPEIALLYSFIRQRFDTVAFETNGTLDPPGLMEKMKKNPPDFVSVSLDSADASVHDSFRKMNGAWKKTTGFCRKLVEAGIRTQVIMSVSDTSIEPVAEMAGLVAELGVYNLKINFITPTGRGTGNNFYQKMNIKNVLDYFRRLTENLPLWVQPSIPGALLPPERLKYLGYCPVRNLLGVLPDGTFSLCGVGFSRKEMAWGRFPKTTVAEAWRNSPILKRIRNSLPESIQGVCSMCMHRDSCLGRCVVNNNETGGSLTAPDMICQAAWEAGLFPETRLVRK